MIFTHICETYGNFITVKQSELAKEFNLDTSSVSTYVKRLVDNGLLARDKLITPTLRVMPTPEGMRLYRQDHEPRTFMKIPVKISIEGIDAFHELDPRATIMMLRFFLLISETGAAGMYMNRLTLRYGLDRHTTQKAVKRLINLDLIEMEEFSHLKKRLKLTEEGWNLLTKMSCT